MLHLLYYYPALMALVYTSIIPFSALRIMPETLCFLAKFCNPIPFTLSAKCFIFLNALTYTM